MRGQRIEIVEGSGSRMKLPAQPSRSRGIRAGGISALCAAMLLAIGSSAARANTVFASFQNGALQFDDTGSPSTSGLFSASDATATFEFHETVTADGVTYTAGQSIPATLDLSTIVNGDATTQTILGAQYDFQPVKDGELKFLDQFGNNLLTISSFTGTIDGQDTGQAANLSTDTILSVDPNSGTYSSDFLNFSPPTDVVASTSLTLNGDDEFTIDSDTGVLNAFSANADGSFSGNVPEPSALGIMGLSSMALLIRRRRA